MFIKIALEILKNKLYNRSLLSRGEREVKVEEVRMKEKGMDRTCSAGIHRWPRSLLPSLLPGARYLDLQKVHFA